MGCRPTNTQRLPNSNFLPDPRPSRVPSHGPSLTIISPLSHRHLTTVTLPTTVVSQDIFNGGLTYDDGEKNFCEVEDECYGVLGGDQQDPSGTSCEGKIGQTLETVPLVFGHWRATDYTRDVRKCPVVGCKGGNNKSHNSKGNYQHYIHRWDAMLPGHGHVYNTRYCTHGHRGIMCSTCLVREPRGMSHNRAPLLPP